MAAIIDSFRGEYYFLSNFYPCKVIIDDIEYPSAEHAFQACKTDDINEKLKIASMSNPVAVKRYGKKVKLIDGWNIKRYSYMKLIIKSKFDLSEDLKTKLINTDGYELIEGNSWNDTYWGVCRGKGYNKLGIILMNLRSEYMSMEN